MNRRRRPRVTPFPKFLDRHSGVLLEMLKWPAGAPSTPGTPGWIMARFVMEGIAERRTARDRIGVSNRYFLNELGRMQAERYQGTQRKV